MNRIKDVRTGIFKKVMTISIILLFLIHFNIEKAVAPTGSLPTISFVDPTDSDGAYINRTYTYVNVSVSDAESPDNLTAFIDWNDSLRGWWRFNENSGTTLTDYSGNGNNGILNNFNWTAESDWTEGRWGSALKFDGNNDYVSISDSASLDITDEFTIEAWVKVTSIPSATTTILIKGVSDPKYDNYLIDLESDGNAYIYVGNGITYKRAKFGTFETDVWYHLVGTFTTTELTAYLNGNQVGNSVSTGWGAYSNSEPLRIGYKWSEHYKGIIDEVRIHSRVLSSEEISASYNAGLYKLYRNFTNLPELTNTYTAYVQDLDGNVNQTGTRTITIDTIPPVIKVVSPLNNTVWSIGTVDSIITFDSKVPTAWYSLDNGLDTIGYNCSGFQTTFDLAEGPHNITVYANNSLGQLTSTIIYFTVNTSCVSGHTYSDWIITTTLNCQNTELIRHGATIIQSGGVLNLNNATIQTYGNITVNAGGSYNLNHSTLKMVSLGNIALVSEVPVWIYYHVDVYGDSNIERSTIMSWDPNTNCTAPKTDRYKGYIKFFYGSKAIITNSNITNLGGDAYTYPNLPALHILQVDNSVILNNTFYNNYIGIKLQGTNGGLFANNKLINNERVIWVYSSNNNEIRDNTIIGGDIGIFVMYCTNLIVEGNTVTNITSNDDSYNMGMLVHGSSNVTIDNNIFTDIGYTGIGVPGKSNNLIIKNNHIDMMEISSKYSNTSAVDWNDPVTGIGILEVMASWPQAAIGAGLTGDDINRSHLTELKSKNIMIENNTFGSNVQVLLHTEGTENLSHDLTNYWQFSYFFPRLTDRNDLYISNDWSELFHVSRFANRTTSYNERDIINIHQKIFSYTTPTRGRLIFFNYIMKRGNITISPQAFKAHERAGDEDLTDFPYDFYLYSPAYTPFGLNKLSTIYANGTTHILLYDDLTEPDGYHTMNMTVAPTSDSVNVTVLNFNNTYKKWTVYSDNPYVTVNHTIGDFTPFTEILIKKNGVDWNTYVSDSDGYISFNYDEGFSTVTFEAQAGSSVIPENCTILKQGWNLISVPLIQGEQALSRVLESIDGLYDTVQWYDASNPLDPWKIHVVGKPFGNDLFELNETMGFWVHITQPGDTFFVYNGSIPAISQQITLHPGWNLVGYPSLTTYNRAEGLNNLAFDSEVEAIWSYNAETQTWDEMGEGDTFETGRGYWVRVSDNAIWDVPL